MKHGGRFNRATQVCFYYQYFGIIICSEERDFSWTQ